MLSAKICVNGEKVATETWVKNNAQSFVSIGVTEARVKEIIASYGYTTINDVRSAISSYGYVVCSGNGDAKVYGW